MGTSTAVTKKKNPHKVSPFNLKQRLQIYYHVVCLEVCQPIIMRNKGDCFVLQNAVWLLADIFRLHCCFHYLLSCCQHC